MAAATRSGDQAGQAHAHLDLGYAHARLGAFDDARTQLRCANQRLGNQTEATACYRHALDLYQEIGARYYQTETLIRLGETHHAAGQIPAARTAWQQAIAILDDLQHPGSAEIKARLSQLDQRR